MVRRGRLLVAGFSIPRCKADCQAPRRGGRHRNWRGRDCRSERERELQAAATASFVEELGAERALHVIVAGDLSSAPDSASVRLWTGRQSLNGVSVCYRDAWESANPG